MALIVGDNSFVTLEDAQGIVDNELYPDSPESQLWGSLDDKSKEIICKRGTQAINSLLFIGVRNTDKYKLKFPRYINNIEVLPEEIKIATVLNGLKDKIIKSSDEYSMIDKGIKSFSEGPYSMSFDTAKVSGIKVYDEAYNYISSYIKNTCRI